VEYFSQSFQDKWVESVFGKHYRGFFVDVGSSDGLILSNTRYLEEKLGWNGICIEPNVGFFKELQNNRKCICTNDLVYSCETDLLFRDIRGFPQKLVSSIVSEIPQNDKNDTAYRKTKTLLQIFQECHITCNIDYMSVDVEQSEYEVLLGFPWDTRHCKLLTIEHNSYANGRELKDKIFNFLISKHYTRAFNDVSCDGNAYEDWYIYNYI